MEAHTRVKRSARPGLSATLVLVAALAASVLGSCSDSARGARVHAVKDEDFQYSEIVTLALEELRRRGGPWDVEKERIDIFKGHADVYGAVPAISKVQAGDGVVINKIGMRLRRIEPGTFRMGSPPNERGRTASEPLREVRISRAFFMGMTEVTNRQYLTVMGKPEKSENRAPLHREDLDAPVNGVSWNDAMEFCSRLGSIDGHKYRLPTEAEWEYACRAGSDGPLAFEGSSNCLLKGAQDCLANDYLWWVGNNAVTQPKPVALKKPNAWGLFDMHGNVAELCLDLLADDNPQKALEDPMGPREGTLKAARGGRFRDDLRQCRSACRELRFTPDSNGFAVGFRVIFVE